MDLLRKEILDITIDYWNKHFSGISALDIADKLKIKHQEVIEILNEFEELGFGYSNKDAKIYVVRIGTKRNYKPQKVITHIFFPSRLVLEEHFKENLVNYYSQGEYTNRLHRGCSQLQHFYFDIAVLKKYLERPEKYTVNDKLSGGKVISNTGDEYVEIRYGKRLLTNGNYVVAVIANNLSRSSIKEQKYWEAFELENLEFAEEDLDFEDYVERNLKGNWTSYPDTLKTILKRIEDINLIVAPEKVFREENNQYLHYPVNNTKNDLNNSCEELYKLIGPDNVNQKILKDILLTLIT